MKWTKFGKLDWMREPGLSEAEFQGLFAKCENCQKITKREVFRHHLEAWEGHKHEEDTDTDTDASESEQDIDGREKKHVIKAERVGRRMMGRNTSEALKRCLGMLLYQIQATGRNQLPYTIQMILAVEGKRGDKSPLDR